MKKYLLIAVGALAVVAIFVVAIVLRSRQGVETKVGIVSTSGSQNATSSADSFAARMEAARKEQERIDALVKEEPVVIKPDRDNDGLTDEEEKTLGTNPLVVDTDGDGYGDDLEVIVYKTDPLKITTKAEIAAAESDLPVKQSVVPMEAIVAAKAAEETELTADTDRDGLLDRQEMSLGTDPQERDTDGDTVSDGDEINKYKTDPLKKDTDGDGFADAEEISKGYNPLGAGKCVRADCAS
ncbi:MAG: hypothetical protein Q7R83_03530 [bacterium]|nr:hypothetical protein [bacterium]